MVAIYKTLPNMESHFNNSYLSLLKSSVLQLERFSLLRRNTLLITLSFGIFCSFWTTLTFKLSLAPFYYGSDIIGLFGILAITGVVLAPQIGKLADRFNASFTKLIAIVLILISVLAMRYYESSLWAFIIATVLLDVGFQAIQITNLAQIYTLDERAHSRINTAYMSSMFVGGAFGTFVGVWCWEQGGWDFVTLQLLILGVLSLCTIIYSKIFKKPQLQGKEA
jgi:predicted MFS family arabinose efflux permease